MFYGFFCIGSLQAQLYADPPIMNGLPDVGIGKSIPEGRLHIDRTNCYLAIVYENSPPPTIAKKHIVLETTRSFDCTLVFNNGGVPAPVNQKWIINGNEGVGLELQTSHDGINYIDLALFNEIHTYLHAQEFSFGNLMEMSEYQTNFKSQYNIFDGKVGIGGVTSNDFTSGDESLIVKGSIVVIDPSNNSKQFKLESNGYLHAREILVDMVPIPDYVFKADYNLMPLDSLQKFVEQEQHLPGIKSEIEYEADGKIKLRELSLKLLEKIEELTLYILNQEKKIKEIESKIK